MLQKSSLTTTLRRIGEELQKPRAVGTSCKAEQLEMRPFFQSSDLHIRLLSSLIILQTISQGPITCNICMYTHAIALLREYNSDKCILTKI